LPWIAGASLRPARIAQPGDLTQPAILAAHTWTTAFQPGKL
jgi:hypothetical protein